MPVDLNETLMELREAGRVTIQSNSFRDPCRRWSCSFRPDWRPEEAVRPGAIVTFGTTPILVVQKMMHARDAQAKPCQHIHREIGPMTDNFALVLCGDCEKTWPVCTDPPAQETP